MLLCVSGKLFEVHVFISSYMKPASSSLSPSPCSHSPWSRGWKGHCWISSLCWRGKWKCLWLRPSWGDLPTRPQGFPDHFTIPTQSSPLSACFPASLDSSLFVSHVGDPKKDLASYADPLTPLISPPSLIFSLDPLLFLASSVSDVSPALKSPGHGFDLHRGLLQSRVTTDNVLQSRRVSTALWYAFICLDPEGEGGNLPPFRFRGLWMFYRFGVGRAGGEAVLSDSVFMWSGAALAKCCSVEVGTTGKLVSHICILSWPLTAAETWETHQGVTLLFRSVWRTGLRAALGTFQHLQLWNVNIWQQPNDPSAGPAAASFQKFSKLLDYILNL